MKPDGHPGSSGNRVIFEEPTDLPSAKKWRTDLVEEISDISTQLSNKNKQDKCIPCNGMGCRNCGNTGGIRWSRERWHAWRQTAITALRARENVLRKLNAWIAAQPAGVPEADVLIEKAYNLLVQLREDLDGDLDAEETEIIESLGAYLQPQRLRQTGT